jgi:hypothetical protein
LEKTADLFSNELRFEGVQTRYCIDSNNCVENFTDEKTCSDSFNVNFVKVNQCGENFVVAVDSISNKPISRISLDAYYNHELSISFLQGDVSFCPYCYNGIKDRDEDGVDCGGSCKECRDDSQTFKYFVISAWSSSIILALFIFIFLLGDKSYRLRMEFFKAYSALEQKNYERAFKHESKINSIYSSMHPEAAKGFSKEIDRLKLKLGDYKVLLKKKPHK